MTFPVLKTGAVAQYPVRCEMRFRTEVRRFVDGSEQRYRDFGSGLRTWTIDLRLLDESELEAVAGFFAEARGRFGSFAFVDPLTGVEYPDCSLEDDDLDSSLAGPFRGRTVLHVKQNRG